MNQQANSENHRNTDLSPLTPDNRQLMKLHSTLRDSLLLAAASSLLAVSYSQAAPTSLTWDITPGTVGTGNGTITGGTGTWNTTNGNWTSDAGANNVTWDADNSNDDTAIFNANGIAGTATVTLGETIDLKALTFSNLKSTTTTQKYTITGGTLAFSSGGTITTGTSLDNTNNAEYASINSAITGSPNVSLSWTGGNNVLVFAPTSGSQALGTVSGNGIIKLAGSTTGNTIVGASSASSDKIRMSSGTWTLTGTAIGYEHFLEGGTLIISTGSLQNNSRHTTLSGGTLHWNNAGAIRDVTISTQRDRDFNITGGSIDQTSGAAITSSTYNPQMIWGGNWTFIGSNGANSNLNMGTGQVFLNGNRQVTVTNAAATLTVGGVIANIDTTARSLTKAGAGTLELRGVNTYTGATTVNAGTLVLSSTGSTSASSAVSVAAGTATGTPVAKLGGTGTVGGNLSLAAESAGGFKNGGVLAPTAAVSGTQFKVTGTTTFNTGSLFEWNMSATTPSTDPGVVSNSGSYGQLAGTGAISGSNAVFNIVLGAGNAFTDAFWNSNKSWTNVFTGAGATTALSSIFSSISGTGITFASGQGTVAGEGYFTLSGTSTLNWTAIPEPSTALGGLLLTAGLLRRRRRSSDDGQVLYQAVKA